MTDLARVVIEIRAIEHSQPRTVGQAGLSGRQQRVVSSACGLGCLRFAHDLVQQRPIGLEVVRGRGRVGSRELGVEQVHRVGDVVLMSDHAVIGVPGAIQSTRGERETGGAASVGGTASGGGSVTSVESMLTRRMRLQRTYMALALATSAL